jgi:hypothetical protein
MALRKYFAKQDGAEPIGAGPDRGKSGIKTL